jgi:hypothetical protein
LDGFALFAANHEEVGRDRGELLAFFLDGKEERGIWRMDDVVLRAQPQKRAAKLRQAKIFGPQFQPKQDGRRGLALGEARDEQVGRNFSVFGRFLLTGGLSTDCEELPGRRIFVDGHFFLNRNFKIFGPGQVLSEGLRA